MEFKLILDQAVVDDYTEYYFRLHPRARKPPIERPMQPSLNQILILPRIQMNALKQKWKDFGVWWVRALGYEGLALERFELETVIYFADKRRHDVDNFCNNKLILDAFTAAQFIVDDDSEHLIKAIASIGYDKAWPRTEFIIRTIEK